jgi:hypothetical protein
MKIERSLERLINRVDVLGEILTMGAKSLQQERERARAAYMALPPGFEDVFISPRRELQFAERVRYGDAVHALIELAASHNWKIYNDFEATLFNLLEADRTVERLRPQNGQYRGLFVFLAIRGERIDRPVSAVVKKLQDHTCPYRLWDYAWAALTDPPALQGLPFVAIGDRVEKSLPGEHRFAPGLQVRTRSMKLEAVSLHAKPNGTVRYHLVATKLNV